MSGEFATIVVKAGKTPAEVLKQQGWPEKTHSALLEKSYNKAFRKVAAKPADKVAKTTSLLVPVLQPKQVLELERQTSALLAEMQKLRKKRADLENQLSALKAAAKKRRNVDASELKALQKRVDGYRADADKLLKSCVKTVKFCASIKYPHEILTSRYQAGLKKLDALSKTISGRQQKDQKAIAELAKQIKALEEQEMMLATACTRERSKVSKVKKVLP